MNQVQAGMLLHLLNQPEPEFFVCHKCYDLFSPEHEEDLFCPGCDRKIDSLDRMNIMYAIEHGIMPEQALYHIMNGGKS